MAEEKDIFADVCYLCTGDFAGIGMMGVLFFARRDLAYKLIVLFCTHYYKPVRNSMRLSHPVGNTVKIVPPHRELNNDQFIFIPPIGPEITSGTANQLPSQ